MRITEREARAVWPGTFLVEDEMEKERNIDYSKIDFKQCELPEWKGKKLFAGFSGTPRVININSPSRCWIAQKNAANKWHLYAQGTIDELKELDVICQKVDAFIESELARIKLEEEYSMSAEQACEFLKANPGEHELAWVCLDNGIGSSSWNRFYSGGVQQKSLDMWVPSCSAGYRYRLIESRPAVKRVVKMTCLELCRRMVAEPGREFQVGEMRYRFNGDKCVIEHSYQVNDWRVTLAMGDKERPIEVEFDESEAAKVPGTFTPEASVNASDHSWDYGDKYQLLKLDMKGKPGSCSVIVTPQSVEAIRKVSNWSGIGKVEKPKTVEMGTWDVHWPRLSSVPLSKISCGKWRITATMVTG